MVCKFSVVFFFKQKTAYEVRISDWSSDVCSSDLEYIARNALHRHDKEVAGEELGGDSRESLGAGSLENCRVTGVGGNVLLEDGHCSWVVVEDRKGVVEGQSVSVRVDLGGRRIIQKNKKIGLDL